MKKNKLFDEIIAKIEKYDKISLFFHSHPDYDALCSCYALKLFIEAKYTKKQVYIARFNNLQAEITKNFFPKIKNKPANFLTQSLGIICDTANIERIAAPEFSKTKEYIKIDHHPNIEPYGSII
jgi:phosphoesterase RecJ-like protein